SRGAHGPARLGDVRARVAPGARRGRTLRPEAHAPDHGAARAHGRLGPEPAVLRARESRPRRGRHAHLPVPADARELDSPGTQGDRAPLAPRRALTSAPTRATLAPW